MVRFADGGHKRLPSTAISLGSPNHSQVWQFASISENSLQGVVHTAVVDGKEHPRSASSGQGAIRKRTRYHSALSTTRPLGHISFPPHLLQDAWSVANWAISPEPQGIRMVIRDPSRRHNWPLWLVSVSGLYSPQAWPESPILSDIVGLPSMVTPYSESYWGFVIKKAPDIYFHGPFWIKYWNVYC